MREHELRLRIFNDELTRLQQRRNKLYDGIHYCPIEEHRKVQMRRLEMMGEMSQIGGWGKAKLKEFNDLQIEEKRLRKAIDHHLSPHHDKEIERLIELDWEIREVVNEIYCIERYLERYCKPKGGERRDGSSECIEGHGPEADAASVEALG